MSQTYPSDLTDDQWEIIKRLVPPDRSGGRPRQVDIRRVVNAILYINRAGCQWRMLPRDFPNWKLVSYYFYKWRDDRVWAKIHDALLVPTRRKAGREHDTPSAGSIDSSTVKATEGADRGFDGGKRIQGRKRHKVVDTLGLLLALVVTGARVDDARAVPAVFRQLPPDKYPRLELLWADNKYHNHDLNDWLWNTYTGPIRIVVTRRTDDEPGFKPVRWRWVIERTNGWVKRSRRNAMDYEKTTSSSESMVRISMMKIMLNRLTDEKPEFPFRYPKRPKKSS
jgi:putative transposase